MLLSGPKTWDTWSSWNWPAVAEVHGHVSLHNHHMEGDYGWTKPANMANWKYELFVRVNGQLCKEPACQVLQPVNTQILVIDARTLFSNSCRRIVVRVEIEVKPLDPLDFDCVLPGCKPGPKWHGYDEPSMCHWSDGNCTKAPRKQPIETWIIKAISL